MANLYEIDNAILECLDLETGEILDEEKLNQLEMQRDKKIESVACWYRNLMSDAEQYKAEKQRYTNMEKAATNKAEQLKRYLDSALQGTCFKSTRANISYRKSQSVEIIANSMIPNEYLNYTDPTINKTAIKAAIKKGETVPGAMLVDNQNIQIK